MPRKSHRRRRRDRQSTPAQRRTSHTQTQRRTSRPQAEEDQDQLRQESLRQHINKALTGRRTPPAEQIIKEQKEKWRYQQHK